MEPKVNYTVVGLFVIILITGLIAGVFWLTGTDQKHYKTYLVYMNEPVSGLNYQAPVKFNGVEVGYVRNIQLNPQNPQQVELLLDIGEEVPINISTTATLMMQGITGTTYIGLTATAASAPPIPVITGNKYPIIKSTPSVLVEVSEALHEVAVNVKRAADVFNRLFTKENQSTIKNILHNFADVSGTLAENKAGIKLGIQNISQRGVPDLIQAISQLNNLINRLGQFIQELQANPSVLLRGKQSEVLGPGEK